MLPRHLEAKLRDAARVFPAVTLTGPRQSGKTTLVRRVFADHAYVSLEDPDVRGLATQDPRGFLRSLGDRAVLDEVQRVPDLFSYAQVLIDEDPRPGRYVLTGSENFLLAERISQSLAGRCAVLHLLPLSLAEAQRRPASNPADLDATARDVPPRGAGCELEAELDEVLFRGFYPRLHEVDVDPRTWLSSYVATYVERDVRQIVRVGQLEVFQRFLRLCAGRTGQLLNHASLANDVGVSAPTIRAWLSVLEASFLIRRLPPHHGNFGKRLVKTPKLHFLDTGLVCYLLGIRSPADLRGHPLRGAIFESFVVSELAKSFLHQGEDPPLFFWRDRTGHEIDVLLDLGSHLVPWEVKSGGTVLGGAFEVLEWWRQLRKDDQRRGGLVHGGDDSRRHAGYAVRSWRDLSGAGADASG